MSYPGYPPYQQGAPGYPPPPNMGHPGMPQPGSYPPPSDSYYPPPNQYPQPPNQYSQPPNQYSQPPNQYSQPPNQYSQPPNQYSQSPMPQPQSYSPYPSGGYPSAGETYPPQGGYPSGGYYPTQSQYPTGGVGSNYPPPSQPYHVNPAHSQPLTSSHHSSYTSAAPHATSPQSYKKGTPTVHAAPDFDARRDAEILRKAMKGFGTDEKAIIQVLANRTNAQRQQIEAQFKTLYGKDLIKDLKSELTGRFEELVVKMMMPIAEFYAHEVHDAISGLGTNEEVLIEVLCTMSNGAIRAIKDAYYRKYKQSMEDDLRSDTAGSFKRLLTSLCSANRDESFHVDPAAARMDAQELLRAGELRFGTDESTFNAILCSRNIAQLQLVFTEYQNLTGHPIDKAIKKEFSGDIEQGLLAIIASVRDKAGFYAERLHNSMAGLGTKDRALIRIIITRSEIDMVEIKQAFMSKYGKSLEDFISGDTSGDYKKCLLALITG